MLIKLVADALDLLVLVVIGMVASRRMHGPKDYFAAGKGLGFLSVAFSARATGESAWLLLGVAQWLRQRRCALSGTIWSSLGPYLWQYPE